MSDHKDMTHRHLRHKLQSLGRRLDELEEATNKLQKSEDELLDLQVSGVFFVCAFQKQCEKTAKTKIHCMNTLMTVELALFYRIKSSRQKEATHPCLVMWRS